MFFHLQKCFFCLCHFFQNNSSALQIAIQNGHLSLVVFLIDKNIDLVPKPEVIVYQYSSSAVVQPVLSFMAFLGNSNSSMRSTISLIFFTIHVITWFMDVGYQYARTNKDKAQLHKPSECLCRLVQCIVEVVGLIQGPGIRRR